MLANEERQHPSLKGKHGVLCGLHSSQAVFRIPKIQEIIPTFAMHITGPQGKRLWYMVKPTSQVMFPLIIFTTANLPPQTLQYTMESQVALLSFFFLI